MNRDVLGDGHNERHLGLDGLDDGGCGMLSWDEDGGDVWLDRLDGLGEVLAKAPDGVERWVYLSDGVEDGQVKMGLAAFAR
jgi:hypothetical protein